MYVALLCTGVSFHLSVRDFYENECNEDFYLIELGFGLGTILALGALTVWHGKLINRGETSIEANINKKERERLAKFRRVTILIFPVTSIA